MKSSLSPRYVHDLEKNRPGLHWRVTTPIDRDRRLFGPRVAARPAPAQTPEPFALDLSPLDPEPKL